MCKRLVGFLLLMTLVIGLAGCAGEHSADVVPSQTGTSTPDKEAVGIEKELVALLSSDGPLAESDKDMQYTWGPGNNTLNITQDGMLYSMERVFGSDRYWSLYREGGYVWLVDLLDKKVLDPLAVLEPGVLDMSSMVEFSPDGKYALISYKSGTVLELLDIATGNRTPMLQDETMYSLSGTFLGDGTLMIFKVHIASDAQLVYKLTRYDIASGIYTQLDGTFIAKPTEVKDLIFMVHIAGPWAYTYTDGKLTIVDLRTFEKTVYSLTADEVKNVSYYATVNSIVATVGETKYLLNADGTVEAIAD